MRVRLPFVTPRLDEPGHVCKDYLAHAPVAQRTEHSATNRGVGGSIPSGRTRSSWNEHSVVGCVNPQTMEVTPQALAVWCYQLVVRLLGSQPSHPGSNPGSTTRAETGVRIPSGDSAEKRSALVV